MKPVATVAIVVGAWAAAGLGAALWGRKLFSGGFQWSWDAKWRKDMIARARWHLQRQTLYQWTGGRGNPSDYGVDCSGLIIDCARHAGITGVPQNADLMYRQLPSVVTPGPADVALYGSSLHASHARLVAEFSSAEGRASWYGSEGPGGPIGGGPEVTSPEAAVAAKAWVRYGTDHRVRQGFLGFRTLAGLAQRQGKI